MKHTYASLSEARSNGASSGYYPFLGMPIVFDNFMPYSRAVTPWAGIFSSAEDMAHYMIAHLNQGKYGDKAVVSAGGMTELHRPGIQIDKWSGYGMGWWVGVDFDIASQNKNPELISYTAPVVVSHEGSWANFRTIAIMVPQGKIGVVLLMNSDDPAVESAFAQVGWDVVSIYSGNEPSNYPPREDFIRQHALPIFIGLIILLLASCVWFIRKLRSLRQQPRADKSGWRKLLGYVVIPIAIDILLAWFLLAIELPQARITVWGLLRNAPDLGLLVILVLGLTLGWGAIRTLLMLQAIFRKV
jgi:CubicO group peptidase (beta-lactamase class C family)